MNKIYDLLIKSIKYIETESNKYKKEEDTSSKRLLKDILFDLHEIRESHRKFKKTQIKGRPMLKNMNMRKKLFFVSCTIYINSNRFLVRNRTQKFKK